MCAYSLFFKIGIISHFFWVSKFRQDISGKLAKPEHLGLQK